MTMPNFLVIGAAKSGTTSLHHYLRQHPDIFMCPKKDTFFFNFDGREPDFGGPGDNAWYEGRAVIDEAEYRALFAGVTNESAVGEACAGYLYDPDAPARIHRLIPDAKLIAVLRDPAERAYSSFMQQVRDGIETTTDFAEALSLEADRISQNWRPIWHYRNRGLYFEQMSRYLEHFDRSQLHICLYEDLQQNPIAMLKGIFAFLGVDPHFEPDVSARHNRAGIPASRILYRLIMSPNALKSVAKPLLPARLRAAVKSTVTESDALLHRPDLPSALRRQLVGGLREDVLALQEIVGRDLSHWLL
ncbi:MAG: sulfotransferase [Inquilinus sp.]|nr:sulfotransferase [Inquilinus sp.]